MSSVGRVDSGENDFKPLREFVDEDLESYKQLFDGDEPFLETHLERYRDQVNDLKHKLHELDPASIRPFVEVEAYLENWWPGVSSLEDDLEFGKLPDKLSRLDNTYEDIEDDLRDDLDVFIRDMSDMWYSAASQSSKYDEMGIAEL